MTEQWNIVYLDRAAARTLDCLAVETYGIPTLLLMENAARALADRALELMPSKEPRVLVVCGTGNNGGDGLAAARHLHNRGARVSIAQPLGDAKSHDARVHERIVAAMGIPRSPTIEAAVTVLQGVDLLVDALLGTGLDRDLTPAALRAVREINALGAAGPVVLSADCPSGIDVDTGRPRPEAVVATETLTFAGMKVGFCEPAARPLLGLVRVADIGVPRELVLRLALPSRDS